MHLYPAGGNLLFVVVPVLVPVCQRDSAAPRNGLSDDVLDLFEASTRIG